ncbi:hypothetical protein LIER_21093 [Lithospermum erythrorhizon]|uniref:Uncharacterized protein n=1 Tax=Lithospermum erythrorhizon TaxID=34254 RepID=A0AAV3QRS7_LITER
MSIKNTSKFSLASVLPRALKEEKIMTRQPIGCHTHPGMPYPSCQCIDEDFDGRMSLNSTGKRIPKPLIQYQEDGPYAGIDGLQEKEGRAGYHARNIILPKTFEKLATRAHGVELNIATNKGHAPSTPAAPYSKANTIPGS